MLAHPKVGHNTQVKSDCSFGFYHINRIERLDVSNGLDSDVGIIHSERKTEVHQLPIILGKVELLFLLEFKRELRKCGTRLTSDAERQNDQKTKDMFTEKLQIRPLRQYISYRCQT